MRHDDWSLLEKDKVNILYKTKDIIKGVLTDKYNTAGNWSEKSAQLGKNMFLTGKIIFSNWKPKIRGGIAKKRQSYLNFTIVRK